jgi:hypothetical protein
MQQPMNSETWQTFRTEPIEWFKRVERREEVNPHAGNEIPGFFKPYRP